MPTQHIATLLGATCCARLANMLRAFGHRIAMCYDKLGVVGSMIKFEPKTPNTSQHAAIGWPDAPNNVAITYVGTL